MKLPTSSEPVKGVFTGAAPVVAGVMCAGRRTGAATLRDWRQR